MPYLHCQRCRLTVHRAGLHATTEGCPRCDAPLARTPRRLFPGAGPSLDAAPRRRFTRSRLPRVEPSWHGYGRDGGDPRPATPPRSATSERQHSAGRAAG